ncbi:MAG: hypothetical protein WCY82_01480 [Desulfotomaculaceae bacterium]
MKILIITSSYDFTVDYFIEKFRVNADFFRFNTDLFGDFLIEVNELRGWSIKFDRWKLEQNQIDSVYYRKPSFPDMSLYEPKFYKMIQKDLMTMIQGIVETFNGRCLSKPSILGLAENKVYQLSVAKEIGFKIPRTLISNTSNAAYAFCSKAKSIIKPLSSGKIYTEGRVGIIQTNMVNNDYDFDGLEISPSYFQEYIRKDYEVRVTIIDNNVFAVKIESSNKVDWRKSGSKNLYSKIELPQEIETKCFHMLSKLNLKFGAFDFIVNENEYYFLEINPNGQWYWLEDALDLNISECIFNYLVGSK